MPARPVIELRDVDIDIEGEALVRGLSVDVAAGRVLAIVSEQPKVRTALARVLSGDAGDYRIGGDLVMEGRELISVVGNVTQAELHVARVPAAHASRARVHELAPAQVLERVGLGDPALQQTRAHALDETQRIRAAFAESVATFPRVLLVDLPYQPEVGSHYATRSALVQALGRDGSLAIIVITDSLAVASDVADDVLVMLGGMCVEWGSVYDICMRPAMPYVYDLLKVTPSPHRVLPDFRAFVDVAAHQGCPWVLNCDAGVSLACSKHIPPMRDVALGHKAACHLLPGGVDA